MNKEKLSEKLDIFLKKEQLLPQLFELIAPADEPPIPREGKVVGDMRSMDTNC
jgi:hypothetical protein